jgi:uncharacterized protein (UPF0303 family)
MANRSRRTKKVVVEFLVSPFLACLNQNKQQRKIDNRQIVL